ncbi:hypothetical protein [Marinomonas shanghaiensis]|uniref:hypothetical protein n=1 Tax=Marinomonas shanghaiensis TaxID=2202418 RepID=UPI003A8E1DAD
MSIERVGHTALSATAFGVGRLTAVITLYGFTNAVAAILTVLAVFYNGFPITYYSAKHGLDIDLLTEARVWLSGSILPRWLRDFHFYILCH